MYTCAHAQRVRRTAAQTNTTHVKMEITLFPFREGEIEIEGEKNREKERMRENDKAFAKKISILMRLCKIFLK